MSEKDTWRPNYEEKVSSNSRDPAVSKRKKQTKRNNIDKPDDYEKISVKSFVGEQHQTLLYREPKHNYSMIFDEQAKATVKM